MGSRHACSSGHWHFGRGRYALSLFWIALLWQGCTSVAIQRGPTAGAGIAPGDGFTVILFNSHEATVDGRFGRAHR